MTDRKYHYVAEERPGGPFKPEGRYPRSEYLTENGERIQRITGIVTARDIPTAYSHVLSLPTMTRTMTIVSLEERNDYTTLQNITDERLREVLFSDNNTDNLWSGIDDITPLYDNRKGYQSDTILNYARGIVAQLEVAGLTPGLTLIDTSDEIGNYIDLQINDVAQGYRRAFGMNPNHLLLDQQSVGEAAILSIAHGVIQNYITRL